MQHCCRAGLDELADEAEMEVEYNKAPEYFCQLGIEGVGQLAAAPGFGASKKCISNTASYKAIEISTNPRRADRLSERKLLRVVCYSVNISYITCIIVCDKIVIYSVPSFSMLNITDLITDLPKE
jgi:hypothetical protein